MIQLSPPRGYSLGEKCVSYSGANKSYSHDNDLRRYRAATNKGGRSEFGNIYSVLEGIWVLWGQVAGHPGVYLL